MKTKLIFCLIILCLVPTTADYSSSQIHVVVDSIVSDCSNMTVEIDSKNITISCTNISEIYDHRPQLANDSIFSDIMTNYSELLYSFYSANDRIILPGMNGSTYFEVMVELESYTGPVVDYIVVNEESLDYNMTMILERTLEELELSHHTLEDDIVRPYLWSGDWGLPTFGGPNNFYLGNLSFDELHWEIKFRTNNTQTSTLGLGVLQEVKVTANAIMIFLGNGTLLDFYIEPIPLTGQSPIILYTLIAISATVIIGLVVVLFRRRR